MTRKPIYLDHAATTFPEEAVIDAMAACMREIPWNPSAAYGAAAAARKVQRLCRQRLAEMLGCDSAEIIFTSGGTESNNQALQAFRGKHAVVSAIEHASVLEPVRRLCEVTLVQPDETGFVSPEAIETALRPDTALICLQWANNETGVIQPIQQVHALAKARRIHLHVDAVQAFGHIPVSATYCDSLTLSAHKFYGPRGIGALYVRQGAEVAPLLLGGGQESGLRAGTENTPAICGMEKAAALAQADMAERAQRESALMADFLTQLKESILALRILGESRPRLPGVVAIHVPGMDAEQAIARLDMMGVMVSGGAACAAGSGHPSHVYTAMGLTPTEARQVLRVSIGRGTTGEELQYAGATMQGLLAPAPSGGTSSRPPFIGD